MRAYSPDLRAKILAAVDAGRSKTEVARSFGVSLASVKRYVVHRRERGSLEPLPRSGRPPTISPEQKDALRQQLVEQPTAFLTEHCATWEQSHGVRPGLSTMSRAIRELGWTRKKGRWVPPNAMK
jgi:transposase